MIIVVNKKFYKGDCEYVGRPSILGNPYTHRNTSTIAKYKCSTIEESIYKYKEWLIVNITNPSIYNELNRLADIAEKSDLYIGCWCVPFSDCHGNFIKETLELILSDRK